jgi:superfamily I DNA and/or RNA helicase
MVQINIDPIFWDNLPKLKDVKQLYPDDLGKVIRPVIEIMGHYKKNLELNPPIINCIIEEIGVARFTITNLENGKDMNEVKNEIAKEFLMEKMHQIGGKSYQIEESANSINIILIKPILDFKVDIPIVKDKVEFNINITPMSGDYVSFKPKNRREEMAIRSIFNGRGQPKLVLEDNTEKMKKIDIRKYENRFRIVQSFRSENAALIKSLNISKKFKIKIVPNTSVLSKKIKALLSLIERPKTYFFPLLQLFQKFNAKMVEENADFEKLIKISSNDWKYLDKLEFPGVLQQRDFVEKALNTPDFAILEGPPGSGKTTTILEILHQATKRGKKILMVASTHVAVDNVLERIDEERKKGEELHIFPIRIGREEVISGVAKNYLDKEITANETARILKQFKRPRLRKLSEAQNSFMNSLETKKDFLSDFTLDIANVVCGTTIGILHFPEFRHKDFNIDEPFDMMIIDEASKTTLQEFLVPALLAKKWIIIGDKMQLSPFIEEGELEALWNRCEIPHHFEERHSWICNEFFTACNKNIVITDTQSFRREIQDNVSKSEMEGIIVINCGEGDEISNPKNQWRINSEKLTTDLIRLTGARGAIIDFRCFTRKFSKLILNSIPSDFGISISPRIENSEDRQFINKLRNICEIQSRTSDYYYKTTRERKMWINPKQKWIDEVTWRLKRIYELRHQLENTDTDNLLSKTMNELILLLPKWTFPGILDFNAVDSDELAQIVKALRIKSYNLLNVENNQKKWVASDNANNFLRYSKNSVEFFKNIVPFYKKSDEIIQNYLINEIIWIVIKIRDREKQRQWLGTFKTHFGFVFEDLLTYVIGNRVYDTLRIEFPSIIELLQEGLMIQPEYRNTHIYNCTIYKGYDAKRAYWENREVKLEYQHRMHPDISKFVRDNFYDGKQVRDPDGQNNTYNIRLKREFPYRNGNRNIWYDVRGREGKDFSSPFNQKEVDVIYQLYCDFENWAQNNPKSKILKNSDEKGHWSVAVITYYKGQKRVLAKKFKAHFQSLARFNFKDDSKNVKVKICTVDQFQGQEADVVYLSFVRTQSVGFLDSKNRLNVSLSRAKYLQVLVGDRHFFRRNKVKNRSPILWKLATQIPQEYIIEV